PGIGHAPVGSHLITGGLADRQGSCWPMSLKSLQQMDPDGCHMFDQGVPESVDVMSSTMSRCSIQTGGIDCDNGFQGNAICTPLLFEALARCATSCASGCQVGIVEINEIDEVRDFLHVHTHETHRVCVCALDHAQVGQQLGGAVVFE